MQICLLYKGESHRQVPEMYCSFLTKRKYNNHTTINHLHNDFVNKNHGFQRWWPFTPNRWHTVMVLMPKLIIVKVMRVCKCMIMRFTLSCKSVCFRNVSELCCSNSCWPVTITLSNKTKHPVSASKLFHIIWVMTLQFKKNYLKPGTQHLIKHDQRGLSRQMLREVKRDGRKGWRGWEKDDISWVIEMQRNRDGQDERLVMRHWLALS